MRLGKDCRDLRDVYVTSCQNMKSRKVRKEKIEICIALLRNNCFGKLQGTKQGTASLLHRVNMTGPPHACESQCTVRALQ